MKKLFSISFILLSLTACRYEEGPDFTVRTAKHRVVNTWYLNEVYEGSMPRTNDYKAAMEDYKLHIYKDKTYSLTYVKDGLTDYKETGKWSFTGAKLSIRFKPDGGVNDSTSTWRIVLLKENAMWMSQYVDGTYVEFHLED